MMRKLLLAACVIILWSSCGSGNVQSASPAIQEDTLVRLLVELHLADSVMASSEAMDIAARGADTAVENTVLARHGIDRKVFEETMKYYSDRPEEMVKLYDQGIEDLSSSQELK